MKRKLSPEELHLWKNQLKGVKPLSKESKNESEQASLKKPKVPQSPPIKPVALEAKRKISSSPLPLQELGKKDLRHLHIEARLDMHGLTLDQGYTALEKFLARAQSHSLKTVLIITGKGSLHSENTLRRQVPRWVRETALRDLVSSFHYPAKLQDGGKGACYIKIRKKKLN